MIRCDTRSSITSTEDLKTEQIVFVSTTAETTGALCTFRNLAADDSVRRISHASIKTSIPSSEIQSFEYQSESCHWELKINPNSSMQLIADLQHSTPPNKDSVRETKNLIYSWEKNNQGRLASFYAVYFIETMFQHRDYKEINRLLSEVEVSSLTEWSIIALLRSSFSARAYLPAWSGLLSAAQQKLKKDGKDSNRLLRGLIR